MRTKSNKRTNETITETKSETNKVNNKACKTQNSNNISWKQLVLKLLNSLVLKCAIEFSKLIPISNLWELSLMTLPDRITKNSPNTCKLRISLLIIENKTCESNKNIYL